MGQMTSVAKPSQDGCDGCLKPSCNLINHAGDRLCPTCRAAFWAATVLFNGVATTEDEIIPTLVFARTERPESSFPCVEVIKTVDGVRIVKVRPLVIEPECYAGTDVLRLVRIRITSRGADLEDLREGYERVLLQHGARWGENNHGSITYEFVRGYLEVTVGTGDDLSPSQVKGLGGDPLRHPALHFPPPKLVAGISGTVRGSAYGRNPKGFAYALDTYGKGVGKTADKLIPAFAAWHVGAVASERVPPEDRPRVSRILNNHLLGPCEKLQLPEDGWRSDDTVWRDVEDLWPRFVRLYAGGVAPIRTAL